MYLFSLEQASRTGTMAGTDSLQGKILFHLERLKHLEIFSNGNDILFLLMHMGIIPSQFPSSSSRSHFSRRDPRSRQTHKQHGLRVMESHPTILSRVTESNPSSHHENTLFSGENGGASHPVGSDFGLHEQIIRGSIRP